MIGRTVAPAWEPTGRRVTASPAALTEVAPPGGGKIPMQKGSTLNSAGRAVNPNARPKQRTSPGAPIRNPVPTPGLGRSFREGPECTVAQAVPGAVRLMTGGRRDDPVPIETGLRPILLKTQIGAV